MAPTTPTLEPATRRLNFAFWIALAVVVAFYAGAFFVLRLLIPQQEIAGTLAAMVLGGGAYVQKAVERRVPHGPARVVPMSGYAERWWLLLAVGVAAIWLASSLVIYTQLRAGPLTAVSPTIDTVLRLLPPAVALLVGIWAGQRSNRFPWLVALAAVLIGYGLSQLTHGFVESLATGVDALPPGGPPGVPPDPRPLLLGEGFVRFLLESQLPLLVAAAMLGFWRGTRTRLAAYIGSLLAELPEADQAALVDLAFESASARQTAAATRSPDEPPVSIG